MGISTAHPTGSRPSGATHRPHWGVRCLPLACAFTWLGGCTAPSLPELKPDPPVAWQHAPPTTANAPAPDLRSWWKAFNDPELDRLIDKALADNLTVRQAVLHIKGARALARRTNAGFLPQLGAHTFSEPTPDSSASYFQLGFDARWELGFFGRAQSHARVTAADLGIARSDAETARVSVVAEVARVYVELRSTQQRLGLLEQLVATVDDKVTLTATRERLRLASANDLARAQAEHASAQAALYEPRLAIERCRQQLAVLLGQSEPDATLVADGTAPQLGDLRIASAPADLLRTRPEIRHAENDVLKAAGELGLARSDLYPRLGLGGSLTYASKIIGGHHLSDADGIVTFGPAIEIPLFDWGARRAIVRAHDADLSASVLAYRQAVLEGVAETETAMAALEQQRERAAALGRSLAGLERGDAATTTLGRLGLADGFDRATSSAALVQARLEVSQAEQARNIAFIALYKALGGAPLPTGKPHSARERGRGEESSRAVAPSSAGAVPRSYADADAPAGAGSGKSH
jgi:NodT family efflux transporter outer membrane factor (OMF) lipoprotein